MTTPQFILDLREHIGHAPLWVPGCTAVVLRRSVGDAEPEVLVVRRSDTHAWTPVTGIVDPGEAPAVAAAREVLEEADVVATPRRLISVDVVGPVVYDNGDVSSYLDTAFAMDWVSGEPRPADGENTDAHFVPASQLPPMNERFRRVIARALTDEVAAAFEAPRGAGSGASGADGRLTTPRPSGL
jgi:ADP-ribose pyrophosphatase